MKRGSFLIIWILATVALFGISSYHYTCNMRDLCNDENSEEPATFHIMDKHKAAKFNFADLPMHIKSDKQYRFPETYNGMADSVFNHMNLDLNDEIVLRGTYVQGLEIESIKDSITTLEKLNNLKSVLVEDGVNPSKVVIEMTARESLYTKSDTSYDALSIFFREITQEKHAEIDKGIASKVLYADFGSGQFKPDHKLESYALELIDYLKRYPEKNVSIIGHTDNVGNSTANYNLGNKRANNVRDFFQSKGIESSRMKATSKGESSPVATNDTEEGRASNRRIEVEIK